MKPLSRRLPPLQSLVFFEAAARHNSFTLAACEMNITQGAVSKQIKSLEDYLNSPLFIRTGKGVEITQAGQDLYVEIQGVLERLSATTAEKRAHKETRSLSIAASVAIAQYWLFPRIAEFKKDMPWVDINIHSTDVIDEKVCLQYDLAILYGDGDWEAPLNSDYLFQDRIFAVCGPNLEIAHIREPSDLLGEKLLHSVESGKLHWISWQKWLRHFGVESQGPTQLMLFNNLPLLITAAESDLGVALGYEFAVEQSLKKGLLRKICDFQVSPEEANFLVHSKNRPLSPTAAAFRDWLLHGRLSQVR